MWAKNYILDFLNHLSRFASIDSFTTTVENPSEAQDTQMEKPAQHTHCHT